ncbi:MAG: triacylglycerol lipase [Thermoleophilaceae bacterium]|jgi:pimeloyl-ACP methyl ester carboxylesterase|nr:triacylglycerol lipase [Thermoleophilaceae bacterium]
MAISPLPFPPLWRESRIGFEAAALLRSRVFKGEGVEDAGGQPVMLIPGFLAGDDSLGLMTQWLRRTGHRTKSAGIRSNIDCGSASVERLAERLECLAESTGQKVAIIGQSRGGNLAKVLAVRHPELVSGIVTLGSPQLDPFDVHPLVRAQVYAVGTLGTLGVRGLFKHGCRHGACCERFWEDLAGPMPKGVGYLSVYSKTDGIVRWRACLDPEAEHLEIKASHVGMAVHPRGYRAIAAALADFRAADPGPGKRGRRPKADAAASARRPRARLARAA